MFKIALLMLLPALSAVDGDPHEHEAEAKAIESMLIAPCCFRAPVSDHYSGAADQVRKEIREMLAKDMSRDEILKSYVEQHGQRILSAPPAEGFHLTSWLLPFVALALGAVAILVFVKNNRAPAPEASASKSSIDGKYAKMLEKELKEI